MKQISLHNSLHILDGNKAVDKRQRQRQREWEGRKATPTPTAIWHGHKSFDICVAITI